MTVYYVYLFSVLIYGMIYTLHKSGHTGIL